MASASARIMKLKPIFESTSTAKLARGREFIQSRPIIMRNTLPRLVSNDLSDCGVNERVLVCIKPICAHNAHTHEYHDARELWEAENYFPPPQPGLEPRLCPNAQSAE